MLSTLAIIGAFAVGANAQGCVLDELGDANYANAVTSDTLTAYLMGEKEYRTSGNSCGATWEWGKVKSVYIHNQDLSGGITCLQDPLYSMMDRVQTLEIVNCGLPSVPEGIFVGFKGLTTLTMTGNGYIGYPPSFFDTFSTNAVVLVDDCSAECPATNTYGIPCGMDVSENSGAPGACVTTILPSGVAITHLTGCGSTSVPNSNFGAAKSLGGTLNGPTSTVVCNWGYLLNGDAVAMCTENGMTKPSCDAIQDYCAPINSLDNGAIDCASATEGTKCTYTCNDGFQPNSYFATCLADTEQAGAWSGFGCIAADTPIDACADGSAVESCQAAGDFGALCLDDAEGPGFECDCTSAGNFTYSASMSMCTYSNMDYCLGHTACSDRGDVSAVCVDGSSRYTCTCGDGFTFDGSTCEDSAIAIPDTIPTDPPATVDPDQEEATVDPDQEEAEAIAAEEAAAAAQAEAIAAEAEAEAAATQVVLVAATYVAETEDAVLAAQTAQATAVAAEDDAEVARAAADPSDANYAELEQAVVDATAAVTAAVEAVELAVAAHDTAVVLSTAVAAEADAEVALAAADPSDANYAELEQAVVDATVAVTAAVETVVLAIAESTYATAEITAAQVNNPSLDIELAVEAEAVADADAAAAAEAAAEAEVVAEIERAEADAAAAGETTNNGGADTTPDTGIDNSANFFADSASAHGICAGMLAALVYMATA